MRTSRIILIETLEMSFVGNSFLRKFRSIFFNLFKHKYFIFYKIGIDEVIAQENSSNISTDCIKAEQCPDTNVSHTNYTEA